MNLRQSVLNIWHDYYTLSLSSPVLSSYHSYFYHNKHPYLTSSPDMHSWTDPDIIITRQY